MKFLFIYILSILGSQKSQLRSKYTKKANRIGYNTEKNPNCNTLDTEIVNALTKNHWLFVWAERGIWEEKKQKQKWFNPIV